MAKKENPKIGVADGGRVIDSACPQGAKWVDVKFVETQQDIRTGISLVMEARGSRGERQSRQVATAGQAEMDLCFDLDGVLNKIDHGERMDKNLFELPSEENAKIPQTPGSLENALSYLETGSAFLLTGYVFTTDFFGMWISRKRNEADAARLHSQLNEFFWITACSFLKPAIYFAGEKAMETLILRGYSRCE